MDTFTLQQLTIVNVHYLHAFQKAGPADIYESKIAWSLHHNDFLY